ncbi:UNVERIFIED_CONTAM: Ahsa1 [Trichonephila clavipes]
MKQVLFLNVDLRQLFLASLALSHNVGKQLNEHRVIHTCFQGLEELQCSMCETLVIVQLPLSTQHGIINVIDITAKNCTKKETFETSEIRSTQVFKCTADEFYKAMTEKALVQAFTQGNCVLESEEGGKFELFDGNVQGFFVKLVPCKTIQQKWRFKTWPEGHFSDVKIDINQKSDCTEVHVLQVGVPKAEFENTSIGWKRFYWDSIKRTLGFGAILF